jgi:hypothetical protein
LVWVAALIGTTIGPVFADVARFEPPPDDGGVSRWYCDGANKVQLPNEAITTIADSRKGFENHDKGEENACAAFFAVSAYAFADPSGDGGAGRCCHAARERFRLEFFDLVSWNSGAVPEPPTPAIMLVGFASIGLAACGRKIRNRAATSASRP